MKPIKNRILHVVRAPVFKQRIVPDKTQTQEPKTLSDLEATVKVTHECHYCGFSWSRYTEFSQELLTKTIDCPECQEPNLTAKIKFL